MWGPAHWALGNSSDVPYLEIRQGGAFLRQRATAEARADCTAGRAPVGPRPWGQRGVGVSTLIGSLTQHKRLMGLPGRQGPASLVTSEHPKARMHCDIGTCVDGLCPVLAN